MDDGSRRRDEAVDPGRPTLVLWNAAYYLGQPEIVPDQSGFAFRAQRILRERETQASGITWKYLCVPAMVTVSEAMMSSPTATYSLADLRRIIEQHWGYRTFRPLQERAMRAVLDGRDSLVVLPTGGGKSLCYQAPAVLRGGTTVVVSPLISLMKDQVDSLRACGVPAAQIDSSLSPTERNAYEMDVLQGAVRLLFVSPERLVLSDFCRLLQRASVHTFAIDEAHCISHWGHDFRPEYRQLNRIKELFPAASIHGYTATATEQVRKDICVQLGLRNPEVLVGNFDRPNLTYRILPRQDLNRQVLEVLDRHAKEAGIVYCMRRRDVDDLNAYLQGRGYRSLPYHAGLTGEERRAAQEAFAAEKCDLIVATVAFGMGIDRSNIRFVLHIAMPKSVEHYQQEIGRAGRDGLEAECVLLHSGADFISWKGILQKSAEVNDVDPDFLPNALKHLNDMDRYCRGGVCRHRALVSYFGQGYEAENCGACDVCLGDTEPVPEAQVVAQKILSCVARVNERFGVMHVVSVLRGENTEKVRSFQHDQLSTFGLLREHDKSEVRDWIYQLVGQGALIQDGGDRPILRLTEASWEIMKSRRSVRLVQPMRRAKEEKPQKSKADTTSWEGVDRGLFEVLRELRKGIAEQRQVPSYIIFGDATLRELARARPSNLERMRLVYGIGDAKLQELGERFLAEIAAYCAEHGLKTDIPVPPALPDNSPRFMARPGTTPALAFELFRKGRTVEQVMFKLQRKDSTVVEYLCDFIRRERPASIEAWVPAAVYERVANAARQVGADRLKPIFLFLNESVPYEQIRLVVTHLNCNRPSAGGEAGSSASVDHG
jgi:ATP-dependent DNA helicase RecQ